MSNPVAMAVSHARASNRFAVWARQQAARFPWAAAYYIELANGARLAAHDHLQTAWRMKADIAGERAA